MLLFKFLRAFLILVLFNSAILFSRDVIVEFKGDCFLPVNSTFRDAYKGGGSFGSELTVQLRNESMWYGFASVDYFKKKGRHLSIADSTTLRLIPLAIGFKYFVPIRDRANFYTGLGFQAARIKKKDRHACVIAKDSQWGVGALIKMGAYVDLKHNFLLDLFFNSGFVRTHKNHFYGPTKTCSKAKLSSAIFGVGLGYRF